MGKNQWHIVVFKAYMVAAFSFMLLAFALKGCVTINKYYPTKRDTVVICKNPYQYEILPYYNTPFGGDTLILKNLPFAVDTVPKIWIDSTGKWNKIKLGSVPMHNTIIETGGYKINLSYSPDTLVIK